MNNIASDKFQLLEPPFDTASYLKLTNDNLSLEVYNEHLSSRVNPIKTFSGKTLRCLANEQLHQAYEVEIYEKGNLPTRENNWHDYFNFCIWMNFPKTKTMINHIQYTQMKNRVHKNRTAMENAMTLFDENGLIVLSSNSDLLEMIRQHSWKALFWDHRQEVLRHLKIVIIGHSMYEKFLNPYIGMTGHAILYQLEELNTDLKALDQKIAEDLEGKKYQSPRDFQPIPILGYPGWYPENANEYFYENRNYFRDVRQYSTL